MIKFLSACSGIEAASVAFKPLGWEPLAFAEIEPFPCKVLAHRYGATAPITMPDPETAASMEDRRERQAAINAIRKYQGWGDKVLNLGDFTTAADDPMIVDADVLCGGTPCQSFSFAGLRQSMEDARGNLTLEFVRLADAIDHLRLPAGRGRAVVLWENVPGVLSTDDNAFGCFLGALVGSDAPLVPGRGQRWTRAGLVTGPKRTAAWIVKDAQYFGLAQRRKRVFVVASAPDVIDPAQILFEPEGVRRYSPPSRGAGPPVAALTANGVGTCGADDNQGQAGHLIQIAPPLAFGGNDTRGLIEVATARNAHGGPHGRMDFESETFIAEPIAFDTTQITHPENRSNPQPGDPCHPLTATAHPPTIAFSSKDHGADAAEDLSPTLRAMNHTSGSHANGGGQVAVAFSMRGRDGENMIEPEPEDVAPALRAAGGGSDKAFVATSFKPSHFTRGKDGAPSEVAPPLTADADKGDQDAIVHATEYQVRRILPVECERLQGFEDGYTDVPDGNKGAPDGPRYRSIGNSWAVPVVAWIGARIDAQLKARHAQ
jgi:DNA (cytosine-5)-methyltransferase 1